MKCYLWLSIVNLWLGCTLLCAQGDPQTAISVDVFREHLKTLSSDVYEGRGPGTPGGKKARDYLIKTLQAYGAKPGNHGEWIQQVPLRRVQNSRPKARVTGKGIGEWTLSYGKEFVGENRRGNGKHDATGELVFVGYGCQAPEYEWDDYAGLDVKGKVLVMLVGDPPTEDRSLFGGKAMTYYGRWTYKFDKARDMGAAGCIVVHRAPWAGYGWPVVVNSWNGRHMNVRSPDADRELPFEGWVTWETAQKMVTKTGKSLDELAKMAARRDFKPIPLGLEFSSTITTETENFDDENVVGIMSGSDPYLKNEYVVFTAHYDHLGAVVVKPGEDGIYNGAVDNASGCASVLSIAKAFGSLDGNHKRSLMFLFVCSEEQGLLGSKYYSLNPIVPVTKTVANINIDGMNVHGITEDLQVIGLGQSDLDKILTEELKRDGRVTGPDSESEKGYYYRSDHFNFAKVGIPALYTKTGDRLAGQSGDAFVKQKDAWRRNDYHRPSDEYDAKWALTGGVADSRVLFRVGRRVANQTEWPRWSETSEFRDVRQKSLGLR